MGLFEVGVHFPAATARRKMWAERFVLVNLALLTIWSAVHVTGDMVGVVYRVLGR